MRIRTKVAAFAIVGSTAGLGFVAMGAASPAFAACPASNQSTAPTTAGPVYTNGSSYVGVGGTAPTGQGGYIEADGSPSSPSSGYIVASGGTTGYVVQNNTVSPC